MPESRPSASKTTPPAATSEGLNTTRRATTNRANAQKSTGPRTEEGRSRSSRNALRHGLLSLSPVACTDETVEAWRRHRDAILDAVGATDYLEVLLAERLALDLWRLARVARHEAACIDANRQLAEWRNATNRALEDLDPDSALFPTAPPDCATASAQFLPAPDDLDKIQRYETHLERGVLRFLNALRARTQRPLPVEEDVTSEPKDP